MHPSRFPQASLQHVAAAIAGGQTWQQQRAVCGGCVRCNPHSNLAGDRSAGLDLHTNDQPVADGAAPQA